MHSLATTQGIQTSKLTLSIWMGTESGFKCLRTWPGCSLAVLWLLTSETADLLGISLTTISGVYGEWCQKEEIPSEAENALM